MKRLLICFSLIVCAALFFAAGCAAGDAEGSFKDVDYNYEQNTLKAVPDADMKIDGDLSEEKWQGLHWVENHDTASGVNFRFTMFFSDTGLYFAAVSEDWRVYYASEYAGTKNSGFNVYIARGDDYDLQDRFYVTFDCGNTPYTHGMYSYASHVTTQGGEYNSGDCTGMTLEAYVPWKEFGYESAPEKMRAVCSYVLVSGIGSSATTRNIWPGYSNGSNYAKYYEFDETGYTSEDAPDAVLGDSKTNFAKSSDWDLSRSDENIYSSNKSGQTEVGWGQGYIFFRDIYSDDYLISATFYPDRDESGSCGVDATNPKAGLLVGYNKFCFSGLLINMNSSYLKNGTLSISSAFSQNGSTADTVVYTGSVDNFDDGVTLSCVKSGTTFFYFLGEGDGAELIYMEEIPLLGGESEPGIQTQSCNVTIKNAKGTAYEDGSPELTEFLNAADIYLISVEEPNYGIVSAETYAVKKGGDLELTVRPSTGYNKLVKFEISENGEDYDDFTDEIKRDLDDGIYTYKNVTSNLFIRAEFTKLGNEEVGRLSGSVTQGGAPVSGAEIIAVGAADKSMYYTASANASGKYSMSLPKGEYVITVRAAGCKTMTAEGTVTVGAEGATADVTLTEAEIGGKVVVNGVTLVSSAGWDYSRGGDLIVSDPSDNGDEEAAWLNGLGAAENFKVTAVFEYTGGSDADPSGGFVIGDGKAVYAVYALGNDAGYGSGIRLYEADTIGNRYQKRDKTSEQIRFTGGKVIMTFVKKGNVYSLYGDMYEEGMTEAKTLRGTLEAGKTITCTTGSGEFVLPSGEVAVGISFRKGSSCTVQVLHYGKNK